MPSIVMSIDTKPLPAWSPRYGVVADLRAKVVAETTIDPFPNVYLPVGLVVICLIALATLRDLLS